MRRAFSMVVLFLLIFSNAAPSQDLPSNLDECSALLATIEEKVEPLSQEEILTLFRSVDDFCMRSVEFSEWVNEVLYLVLTKQPHQFLAGFEKTSQKNQDKILHEISHPVHDAIDIKGAHVAFEGVNQNSKWKEKISKALEEAASLSGIDLK